MSNEWLRTTPDGRLFLGDRELHDGDRIETWGNGQWLPAVVRAARSGKYTQWYLEVFVEGGVGGVMVNPFLRVRLPQA